MWILPTRIVEADFFCSTFMVSASPPSLKQTESSKQANLIVNLNNTGKLQIWSTGTDIDAGTFTNQNLMSLSGKSWLFWPNPTFRQDYSLILLLLYQGKRERDALPRLVEEPHHVKKVAYCRLCTAQGTLQVKYINDFFSGFFRLHIIHSIVLSAWWCNKSL